MTFFNCKNKISNNNLSICRYYPVMNTFLDYTQYAFVSQNSDVYGQVVGLVKVIVANKALLNLTQITSLFHVPIKKRSNHTTNCTLGQLQDKLRNIYLLIESKQFIANPSFKQLQQLGDVYQLHPSRLQPADPQLDVLAYRLE
ncbi:unnamed protein product [Paramecium sonneborni]|uniref:Uncharacterized protein n=1 Tax=Paramecium sonneborni TaxID=65129 RepID=A0A8S1QQA4_9CILI|nr:unnamed protein product [Paramecium sonneborni]